MINFRLPPLVVASAIKNVISRLVRSGWENDFHFTLISYIHGTKSTNPDVHIIHRCFLSSRLLRNYGRDACTDTGESAVNHVRGRGSKCWSTEQYFKVCVEGREISKESGRYGVLILLDNLRGETLCRKERNSGKNTLKMVKVITI